METERYPNPPKVRHSLLETMRSTEHGFGITAVGFAWQHVLRVGGYLHDQTAVTRFLEESAGKCWNAIFYTQEEPGFTRVSVYFVAIDKCYTARFDQGMKARWIEIDPSVELLLRRLHHR